MSGAFLTPDQRPDARQRDAQRNLAQYHEDTAQSCYRWATALLVAGMAVIAIPQMGLEPWHWHIVAGVALLMVIFSIRMMIHGSIGNGIICLVCALAVLPGWVFIADDVVRVGYDLYGMIAKQWKDKLG